MLLLLLLASLVMLQEAPVPRSVSGRITVDDGSPVPTVVTFRGPNVQFGIQASMPGSSSRVADATTLADGSFVIPLTLAGDMGAFSIEATRVPLGYFVKSMRYGTVDLLRSPLVLSPTSPANEIQIVLTKSPPAGTAGFKVSGRIANWTAATSVVVSMQAMSTGSVLRIGNAIVNADGSFEVPGVPPGRYRGFSPPNNGDLLNFEVLDRDVNGLQVTLPPGALSLIMTSMPFGQRGQPPRPTQNVPAPTAPLTVPTGSAVVSVSQNATGWGGRKLYEGALSFFRIEQSGTFIEEKRLEDVPLTFTLPPGSYVLHGYFRGCDGNCGRLSSPEAQCTAPFVVTAGQALYAERIFQSSACTIRFNAPPGRQ